MDPFSLRGKVALVTGGAGDGIGHGLSTALAERGAAVVVADLDAARAERLALELTERGLAAHAAALDVRRDESVQAAIATAVETFGGLDALVNSAGIGMVDRIDSFAPGDYENL